MHNSMHVIQNNSAKGKESSRLGEGGKRVDQVFWERGVWNGGGFYLGGASSTIPKPTSQVSTMTHIDPKTAIGD